MTGKPATYRFFFNEHQPALRRSTTYRRSGAKPSLFRRNRVLWVNRAVLGSRVYITRVMSHHDPHRYKPAFSNSVC